MHVSEIRAAGLMYAVSAESVVGVYLPPDADAQTFDVGSAS
jgi:hypothetical protein